MGRKPLPITFIASNISFVNGMGTLGYIGIALIVYAIVRVIIALVPHPGDDEEEK